MKIYKKLFRGITYYMFGIFLLFAGLALIGQNFMGLFKIIGLFALWILLDIYLNRQKPYAFIVSFSFISLLWIPLLYQTYARVIFVIENGGFERADGYGSPLAFLIGIVFEQIFFIPLSILFISGLVTILLHKREKEDEIWKYYY